MYICFFLLNNKLNIYICEKIVTFSLKHKNIYMSEELYYIEENFLEYGSSDGWGWSPSQVFYNTGKRNNDIYVIWIKNI